MSIRKVSDLPELELGIYSEQDLNDSLIEVSMMSSIYEGESRTGYSYVSKNTTFQTLRDLTVSRLSALLSNEWILSSATHETLGGVRVNLENDTANNVYGVSSDEDSRLFVKIPRSEQIESIDYQTPDSDGKVILNSISNIIVDNDYLSVLPRIYDNRDLSIVLNMHMGPDFSNCDSLGKEQITSGISAIDSDMFVYMGVDTGNGDSQITCQMATLSSADWKNVQIQFIPATRNFGTSFNLRRGYSVRMVASENQFAEITGYKCEM